jgi:membrane protease YdiL (CAAX protease family)
VWSIAVPLAAGALWLVSTGWWRSPAISLPGALDRCDLAVMATLYLAVVGLWRLAFTVFGADRWLGLFLCFGGGMVLGVAVPVIYTVWLRRRPLASLGIGTHQLRATVALGVLFGGVQAVIMLWGYQLPAPVDWMPLLVGALAVGLFEAIFFRGFIQGHLEASLGTGPAVAGAAALYALYHLGYGMGLADMGFLFALGVVYAVVYRLTSNILVLWPLLTPWAAGSTCWSPATSTCPGRRSSASPTCSGSWRWSSGGPTSINGADPAAHHPSNPIPPSCRLVRTATCSKE